MGRGRVNKVGKVQQSGKIPPPIRLGIMGEIMGKKEEWHGWKGNVGEGTRIGRHK